MVTGYGTVGHTAGAPYDRGMITAATWDLPVCLFDQISDGGRILAPVELRGGVGCAVAVLRRRGRIFVAEAVVPGWFVPLLGGGQDRRNEPVAIEDLPFWDDIQALPVSRHSLPLGTLPGETRSPVATQFLAFLGRTEPGLHVFASPAASKGRPWMPSDAHDIEARPFGLADAADRSVAYWHSGEVVSLGGPSAARRLAQAYQRWTALGLPGMNGFSLEIHPKATAPAGTPELWIEPRGETVLAWRIAHDKPLWHTLLD